MPDNIDKKVLDRKGKPVTILPTPLANKYYNTEGWRKSLLEYYNKKERSLPAEALMPPIRVMTEAINTITNVYGNFPDILYNGLRQTIDPLFSSEEYKEKIYTTLKTAAEKEGRPLLNEYAEALLTVRNLFQADRDFYTNHFANEIDKTYHVVGDDLKYQKFASIIQEITTTHVEQVRGEILERKTSESISTPPSNLILSLSSAYKRIGDSCDRPDDDQRALNNYTKAIELNPNFSHAYNSRGVVYNNQGNYKAAIADFNKAIDLGPELAMAYNSRGVVYNNQGNYKAAIADFNKAIGLDPELAMANDNRGNAYYALGDYETALWDYKKAAKLGFKCEPSTKREAELAEKVESSRHFTTMAEHARDHHLTESAIKNYNRSLQFYPGNLTSVVGMLEITAKRKPTDIDLQEVKSFVEKTGKLHGRDHRLYKAYEKIVDKTGRELYRKKHYSDALSLYEAAIVSAEGRDIRVFETGLNKAIEKIVEIIKGHEKEGFAEKNKGANDTARDNLGEAAFLIKRTKKYLGSYDNARLGLIEEHLSALPASQAASGAAKSFKKNQQCDIRLDKPAPVVASVTPALLPSMSAAAANPKPNTPTPSAPPPSYGEAVGGAKMDDGYKARIAEKRAAGERWV